MTPYFLCLHISEIPVTIKGRISYNNESNQKSWLHTFLSSHVLMKTHCEPKIMFMFVFMSSNFRNSCQKRPNFLSQWEQLKVLTPYFLCLHVFKFQKFLSQLKAEFLITMRAIKVLTPYFFVFTCAHEVSLWTKIMAKQEIGTQLQSVHP